MLPNVLRSLLDRSDDSARHIKDPRIQLAGLGVNKEERSSVGVDKLLCLVHDLENESVHAHHLLEYGPKMPGI